jgi:hypothetical protein
VLARVRSAARSGIEPATLFLEVDVTPGLSSFTIARLPDSAGRESRDRIRAASRMRTSSSRSCTGPPETRQGAWCWLAHPSAFGYDSRAMLSRAQETRVRELLWNSPRGTIQTYCIEHLATAAKISSGHLSDLAIFVRTLHERGDCQRRFGGFCDADRHETRQTLVWGPPTRRAAQGQT